MVIKVSLAAIGSIADYTAITEKTWLKVPLKRGTPSYLSYTTRNPGKNCSDAACKTGDRYASISAHTQSHTLRINSTLSRPLTTECNPMVDDCQTSVGSNVGAVIEYGLWNDVFAPGCYKPASTWSPNVNYTIFFSIELLDGPNANVIVYVDSFGVTHPVPGGCSITTFNPFAPQASVAFNSDETTSITFQQADFGGPTALTTHSSIDLSQHTCSCDALNFYSDKFSTLTYEVYRYHVSDCGSDYKRKTNERPLFQALQRMSTVAGVKRHGYNQNSGSITPQAIKKLTLSSEPGEVWPEYLNLLVNA